LTAAPHKQVGNIIEMWENQIVFAQDKVAEMRKNNEPHEKIDDELTWLNILQTKVRKARASENGRTYIEVE